MSQTALCYIGGLLTHGPALLALTNPSTNSYRRLVPGYEAPVNAFFSLGNRSAAMRIPKYADQPETARIEFRPPDATCNPYLALAAQLLAGLDGIRQQIDPTAAGFGPIDADIFAWSSEQRGAIKHLPGSLHEALDGAGGRSRLPAGGRRVRGGDAGAVDRLQAGRGIFPGAQPSASLRDAALFRRVNPEIGY